MTTDDKSKDETIKKMSNYINQLSDILCGHMGASDREILDRAEYLAELEKSIACTKNIKKIRAAIENLQEVLEESEYEDI